MTIEQLYDETIKPLRASDRLRLAAMILNEIARFSDEAPLTPDHPVPGRRSPAEVAAAIANLAQSSPAPQDGFSNRDHDKLLYGDPGAR